MKENETDLNEITAIVTDLVKDAALAKQVNDAITAKYNTRDENPKSRDENSKNGSHYHN